MMPVTMSQWGNDSQLSQPSYDGIEDGSNVRLHTGLTCRPAMGNDSCFGC